MGKKAIVFAAVLVLLGGCSWINHLTGGSSTVVAQEPCPDDLSACTYGNSENTENGNNPQGGGQ
jgi:uncharacterized protein YceK